MPALGGSPTLRAVESVFLILSTSRLKSDDANQRVFEAAFTQFRRRHPSAIAEPPPPSVGQGPDTCLVTFSLQAPKLEECDQLAKEFREILVSLGLTVDIEP